MVTSGHGVHVLTSAIAMGGVVKMLHFGDSRTTNREQLRWGFQSPSSPALWQPFGLEQWTSSKELISWEKGVAKVRAYGWDSEVSQSKSERSWLLCRFPYVSELIEFTGSNIQLRPQYLVYSNPTRNWDGPTLDHAHQRGDHIIKKLLRMRIKLLAPLTTEARSIMVRTEHDWSVREPDA